MKMLTKTRIIVFLVLALQWIPVQFISAKSCSELELDSLRQLLNQPGISLMQSADALLGMSDCMLRRDLDSAVYLAYEGKKISDKLDYVSGKAKYYLILGEAEEISRSYETAKSYYSQSLDYYDQIEEDAVYLRACNNLAFIFELQSNFDEALKYYLLGLDEAIKLDNRLFTAYFYNNLSAIYNSTGMVEKGLEMMFMASPIFKELGHDTYYANSLVNIGYSYKNLEQYDSALNYFLEAEKLQIEMDNTYGLMKVRMNMGDIKTIDEDYSSALSYYESSLHYAYLLDSLEPEKYISLGIAHKDVGLTHLALNDLQNALYHLSKSKIIGDRLSSFSILSQCYFGLSSVFEKSNRLDSALHYHKLFQAANDTILLEKSNNEIVEMEYQHSLKLEKDRYDSELRLISLEKRRQELIIFILIGIFFTIIIIAFFIWRTQKSRILITEKNQRLLILEQEQISKAFERKKKELTSVLLNLVERNEFILSINSKLEEIVSVNRSVNRSEIEGIIKTIRKDGRKKIWEEFELRFLDVHTDFYKELNKNFPDLTSNDRKLCSFLFLDMSSKEISSITFQSLHSIKIARYRLRKKLGIEKNDSLTAFLQNLT